MMCSTEEFSNEFFKYFSFDFSEQLPEMPDEESKFHDTYEFTGRVYPTLRETVDRCLPKVREHMKMYEENSVVYVHIDWGDVDRTGFRPIKVCFKRKEPRSWSIGELRNIIYSHYDIGLEDVAKMKEMGVKPCYKTFIPMKGSSSQFYAKEIIRNIDYSLRHNPNFRKPLFAIELKQTHILPGYIDVHINVYVKSYYQNNI